MTTMTLNSPWFEYVKSGEKIFEGRMCKKELFELPIGTLIKFSHHTDKTQQSFVKKIKNILKFDTYKDALIALPIEKILPNVSTIEEGIEIYKKFVSIESQVKNGILMIELE